MRALLALLTALILATSPLAHADVDGSVPSTGSCPYPATGTFGGAGGEYDYACAFPTEVNGARHTTLFGGGVWIVTATVGVSFLIFNAGVAATIPGGVLRGISYWACPDLAMAEQPNPVGGWNKKINPTPCKPLAPKPVLLRPGQESPPPGVPPPPPPPPEIMGAPVGPATPGPEPPQTGAQTNPVPGNPASPEDRSAR